MRMIDGHPAKLIKGRAALIAGQMFWGSLALSLEPRADTTIATACTDGKVMRYNPAWIESLTEPQVSGLWAHEVAHCALLHPWRTAGRDLTLLQSAGDYVVNELVDEAGLTLPPGALRDTRFNGKSMDAVYAILREEAGASPGNAQGAPQDAPDATGTGDSQQGAEPPQDPGQCGAFAPATEDSPAEQAETAAHWEVATVLAATAAAAAGCMPGSLRAQIAEARKPQIDWAATLRRFFATVSPSDYSWKKLNRRMLAAGFYLPGLAATRLGEIAVFVDTSGSINAKQLAAFSAELNAILDEAAPERVHCVFCHARISHTETYEPQDFPVKLAALETGGTDFRPPFAWVEREGLQIAAAVYLTDLEGSFPDTAPDYPVLWVSINRHKVAPWSETIFMDVM